MNFVSSEGKTCFLGSIRNILNYYGKEIPEGELLFNASGYDFRMRYEEENPLDSLWVECTSFTGKDYLNLDNYLAKHGYKLTSCLLSNEKELYEFILKKTLESVPVMVNTDFYNLPYHSEYRKTHFNHIVVIYDMNDNSVGYSDCCTSIIGMPCYQRYIDWQEFFSMLEEGRVYQVWYIEKNIKRHNTQILGINKPMDVDSDKQFVGVDAIMQLSKIYRSISNSCTLTEKVKDKLRYHYCFFTGFGGPVVTRTLFYSYLKILGEEVLANECLNIKQQWMISSKDIIRATILDNMERINFFSERLVYIADLERKFIDKTTKLKRDIRV